MISIIRFRDRYTLHVQHCPRSRPLLRARCVVTYHEWVIHGTDCCLPGDDGLTETSCCRNNRFSTINDVSSFEFLSRPPPARGDSADAVENHRRKTYAQVNRCTNGSDGRSSQRVFNHSSPPPPPHDHCHYDVFRIPRLGVTGFVCTHANDGQTIPYWSGAACSRRPHAQKNSDAFIERGEGMGFGRRPGGLTRSYAKHFGHYIRRLL